ncbi:hypothetical protein AAFF_G00225850 [Aldrovandia affinis]|uniref:Uncharacterized protein n=1 Tax=Aldrovandia affinis TaxID=143900 RepID=A0AAD7TBT3_9TELE|nr:hypothetical protein AAFF_G00225850 [Aldrovandia affinis]
MSARDTEPGKHNEKGFVGEKEKGVDRRGIKHNGSRKAQAAGSVNSHPVVTPTQTWRKTAGYGGNSVDLHSWPTA